MCQVEKKEKVPVKQEGGQKGVWSAKARTEVAAADVVEMMVDEFALAFLGVCSHLASS